MKRLIIAILVTLLATPMLLAAESEKKPDSDKAKAEKKEEKKKDDDKKDDLKDLFKKAKKKEEETPKGFNPTDPKANRAGKEEENPLLPLVNKMEEVEQALAKEDTSKEVLEDMDQLLKTLDKLIVMAEKKEQEQQQQQQQQQQKDQQQSEKKDGKKKQKGKKKQQTSNPQPMKNRDPNEQNTKTKRKTLERDKKGAVKKSVSSKGRWGLLPKRVAEEAMDGEAEDFDDRYRELLDEYYKRLSRGKNSGDESE